jgi:hypothetical protein
MGRNGVRLKPDPQETQPDLALDLSQIAAERIAREMRTDMLPAAGLDHALDVRAMRTLGFPGLDERETRSLVVLLKMRTA